MAMVNEQSTTSNTVIRESAPHTKECFAPETRWQMPVFADRLGELLDEIAWQTAEARGEGASEFARDQAAEDLLHALVDFLTRSQFPLAEGKIIGSFQVNLKHAAEHFRVNNRHGELFIDDQDK